MIFSRLEGDKGITSAPCREDYKAFLTSLRKSAAAGPWTVKPFSMVRAFGSSASDLLLLLLNSGQHGADMHGWQHLDSAYVLGGLGERFPADRQARLLTKLVNRGCVEVTRKGNRRYCRVMLENVKAALAEV